MAIRSQQPNQSNWREEYRQAVYELTDLFEDHTRDNHYARTLRTEFGSMLGPDTGKLKTLSALVTGAITRLGRKPELFIEGDQGTPDIFFESTVTSPSPSAGSRTPSAHQLAAAHMARTAEIAARVSIIEAMLAEYREKQPGIGHNKPPDNLPTDAEDVEEIEKLIDLLKEAPPKPGAEQTDRVRELSDKIFRQARGAGRIGIRKKSVQHRILVRAI
jgi:hypothetical protein